MSKSILGSPPRSPNGHWLFGQGPEYVRDPLGCLSRLGLTYGDFVPPRLGPYRAVFLNHPDLIEQVLVTHDRSFRKDVGFRRLSLLVGNGLLTSEGEFWRRQRRLVQPAFHRERIAASGRVMVDCTERMLATWRAGEERDIHQEMTRLTLQIVGRALFDVDLGAEATAVGAAVTAALESLQRRLRRLWVVLPTGIPTAGSLQFGLAARRLDQTILGIIRRRRASEEHRGDLLSLLIAAQDEDGHHMTDRQLRDEVMTLLLAGHETTALLLSWARLPPRVTAGRALLPPHDS